MALSRPEQGAQPGCAGASERLQTLASGFVHGSPWAGWSECLSRYIRECLGLFMSVCENSHVCVFAWGCLGVSTSVCGLPTHECLRAHVCPGTQVSPWEYLALWRVRAAVHRPGSLLVFSHTAIDEVQILVPDLTSRKAEALNPCAGMCGCICVTCIRLLEAERLGSRGGQTSFKSSLTPGRLANLGQF